MSTNLQNFMQKDLAGVKIFQNVWGGGYFFSETLCRMAIVRIRWSVVVAVNHTCSPDEFSCANGRCTPQSWVCDADNDCGDRSDEQSCPPRTCLPTEFTCQSPPGSCIPQRFRCDHQHDCSDGSDEIDCRKSGLFIHFLK